MSAARFLDAHIWDAPRTGCVCGHSATAHNRYRECCADGCTCWTYRKTARNDRAAAEHSARS